MDSKQLFQMEYGKTGVKIAPLVPFVPLSPANTGGVKDVVGKSGNQTTQRPVSPSGNVQSSTSIGYDSGVGWWIGFDQGVPKLFIGDSNGNKITWDGTTLTIDGDLVIGGISRTIGPDDDIQTNLDAISAEGGGTLYLKSGTYTLTADVNIPSNVSLVGSGPVATIIDCAGGFVVTCHGTSGTHKTDVAVMNLGIYNASADTALDFQYADRVILSNVQLVLNNNGLILDNCTQVNASTVIATASTGYGITVSNSSLMDWRSVNCESNGGAGMVLNTVSVFNLLPGDFTGNTGNGISITSCSQIDMLVSAATNGAVGIELVSGNSNINIFNSGISGNTSDGIKLTASSDQTKINMGNIVGNGGYGINIADSSCDDTLILGNYFASNTTAAANDSGTATLIRSNIGLADN